MGYPVVALGYPGGSTGKESACKESDSTEWLSLSLIVWQKPTQYCKAIILQLKEKNTLSSCVGFLDVQPGWKKVYFKTERDKKGCSQTMKSSGLSFVIIQAGEEECPFIQEGTWWNRCFRKNCWYLCYRARLEPGRAEEHCNKFSLKSTPIVVTIHLGFVILCSVHRILSKIWDNNGKVMGKLKYIMKALETCTDFQRSIVGAVIRIDSSFKYN